MSSNVLAINSTQADIGLSLGIFFYSYTFKTDFFGQINIFYKSSDLRGGGGSPYIFGILVFEIAVAQQTKTRNRAFEGVVDPNRPPVPVGQPRPYLAQSWLNYFK